MARQNMTGPEHYRETERLVQGGTPDEVAAAQVHATLALAAATALIHPGQYDYDDLAAWMKAAGTTTGGK